MSSAASIVYDVTHLVTKLRSATPNGMARLDLAYGEFLAGQTDRPFLGLHLGIRRPHLWRAKRVARLLDTIGERWREQARPESDPAFTRLRDWLLAVSPERPLQHRARDSPPSVEAYLAHLRGRVERDGGLRVPENAVYLGIAQHGLHLPFFFRWLRDRPDVKPVFMIHDLLPLDYPEYFVSGYREPFERIVEAATRLARGLIVTTEEVAARLTLELRRRGRGPVPIHVSAPPAPRGFDSSVGQDPALGDIPYFVVCGTIEPRKNHLLLLNEWRSIVAVRGAAAPKLVIVGARGWENEQTAAMLEQCDALRAHVIEVSALSTPGLRHVLANARALLMPSFAEGYGLPLGEALALGTPVVASDIPVFREVARGCATLRHPLDGPGWRNAILELSDSGAPPLADARTRARRFEGVSRDAYFDGITHFLDGIGR